jgi:outer membrane protein TolC
MLLYSALEIRDQAAGTALEWYYQLAGAEAKDDLLNDSLKISRDSLQRIEQLKRLGMDLPTPVEEYQRQVVDLELQKARNQVTIEQLNSKLRVALGYQSSHVWRIWPDPGPPIDEAPLPQTLDVEAAVQLGLHQRPQLLLLRSIIANLDRDTLGSARSLLQTLNPLLAMSDPGPSCKLLKILGKILHIQPGQEDEVQRVRAQLCDYLRERERTVEAEIREAVYELGARREAIELTQRAAGSWQDRIRDLKKQQAQGLEGALGLASAYLDWYKARGEVVKEFLGWKSAAVRLKQAQGILPAECGYSECKGN